MLYTFDLRTTFCSSYYLVAVYGCATSRWQLFYLSIFYRKSSFFYDFFFFFFLKKKKQIQRKECACILFFTEKKKLTYSSIMLVFTEFNFTKNSRVCFFIMRVFISDCLLHACSESRLSLASDQCTSLLATVVVLE